VALWPAPADASPPLALDAITREVEAFAQGPLPAWETLYLAYHRRRYQDTLRLLPDGQGRRLLDVGSFPGHLSALAQRRGWEVTGLNNAIEGQAAWAAFLERCRERKIEILGCEVEQEPFPLATASVDAVLFCELFEHLHWNPFHTLREIFRVLRPGGLLVLTTPNLRRAETLFRFLHDWGSQPPLSRTFHELFPSLLYHRHNREYTASELVYYLARQGKDLYDFRLDRVYHADCLDAPHEVPGVLGQRAGPVEQALARGLRRLVPSTRGQLMARAVRGPATVVPLEALRAVEGLGAAREDSQAVQGFTRRLTFPFRPTGARAAFSVPVPGGPGPVLLSWLVAHLAPDDAPPAWTRWQVGGHPAMTLELPPGTRPTRVRLLATAQAVAGGHVRVELETTTRADPVAGAEVGILLGGPFLLAERVADPAALDAALDRTAAERQAEEAGGDRWWHAAESLYVPRRVHRAAVEVGPGDEAQLGPGWYHREHWGRLGAVRWTGPEAIAYLGAPGQPGTVRVRAYSGEPALGPVSGALAVEALAADGDRALLAEGPVALPGDTWGELALAVPAATGPLRVTLRTEAPRVPRERVPGNQDPRPLGFAVRRLWLD
jgi:SAM-dependent methyltransferase